jgi:hypothetical protein
MQQPDAMANRLRGETDISLNGKSYRLRPTFAAIMEIEDRLGGVVPLAARAAKGDFGLRDLAVVIWATLNAVEDQRMSLEEVGAAVLGRGLAAVTPAVRDVLMQILGGEDHDRG